MDGATIVIITILVMVGILFIGAIQAGIRKKKEDKRQAELVETLLKKEGK